MTETIILCTTKAGNPRKFCFRVYIRFSWDEWVPESRALKLNEESLARQLELLDATKSSKQKLAKGSDKKADQASDKNKKRRRDFMMERVSLFMGD